MYIGEDESPSRLQYPQGFLFVCREIGQITVVQVRDIQIETLPREENSGSERQRRDMYLCPQARHIPENQKPGIATLDGVRLQFGMPFGFP
ncbi:MAG: hypothetical protein ABSH56_31115 [Bryobacteraceae bacterium]|jgi:hypothetical protein